MGQVRRRIGDKRGCSRLRRNATRDREPHPLSSRTLVRAHPIGRLGDTAEVTELVHSCSQTMHLSSPAATPRRRRLRGALMSYSLARRQRYRTGAEAKPLVVRPVPWHVGERGGVNAARLCRGAQAAAWSSSAAPRPRRTGVIGMYRNLLDVRTAVEHVHQQVSDRPVVGIGDNGRSPTLQYIVRSRNGAPAACSRDCSRRISSLRAARIMVSPAAPGIEVKTLFYSHMSSQLSNISL